jgi:triosephosphate isomerase (TIM)
MHRNLAAGNWKMNGSQSSLDVLKALAAAHPAPGCDVLICPPATLIPTFAASGTSIAIGAQDCHPAVSGAHTGDLSAEMLAEAGATAIIVGHSERRTDHGESSALVRSKAEAAWRAGLTAIVCVGESETQRDAGETLNIVGTQMAESIPDGATPANLVVAYEPIWAIGTGRTPTLDEITEVHDFMRETLTTRFGEDTANGIRLLYGGSVKPTNAAEIFAIPNVDGGLVGGASLKVEDFGPIIAAAGA